MTSKTAFLHTVKRNRNKLFRYAYRFLKDKSTAEEAVQELIVKLWQKKQQLEKYDNHDAMMMVAMRNHCLDELKKQNRRRNHYQNHSQQMATVTRSHVQEIENKDSYSIIKQCIEELPEAQQTVIQLRDIEQMETDEIKEITGMTDGAIRANLSRARKRIRERMKTIHNYGLE